MNMNGAPSSDPRTNVSHQVSVDPVDDTGINVSNLEERGHLGFLAPPSTQITSAMRQAPSVSVTITVMPACGAVLPGGTAEPSGFLVLSGTSLVKMFKTVACH